MKIHMQSPTPALAVLPEITGNGSTMAGVYRTGEDSAELFLRGVSSEDYEGFCRALDVCSDIYTENSIAGNRFVVRTGVVQGRTLYTGYFPTLNGGTLRVVDEPTGYMPAVEPATYTRVCPTTIAQLGRRAADINVAPGMSYVVQVASGEFLVIDGGPTNEDDIPALLDYMKKLTPEGKKPTVAAWLITHAHSDHMALANHFLERYRDEIELKMVGYNFPVWEAVKNCHDVKGDPNRYLTMIEKFRANAEAFGAEQLVLHAGQRLYFADVTLEVLFTHEEQYPLDMPWINHTSLAFRLVTESKTVMILGDCEKTLCQQMADVYGEELKSDILQLSHHGVNGACVDLYRLIDPEVCFWAISQEKYENDPRCLGTLKGYEFNGYIRDESIRVRRHYASSTTTVIQLS